MRLAVCAVACEERQRQCLVHACCRAAHVFAWLPENASSVQHCVCLAAGAHGLAVEISRSQSLAGAEFGAQAKPRLQVLHDSFGMKEALKTTVHSTTATQKTVDLSHLRRSARQPDSDFDCSCELVLLCRCCTTPSASRRRS